MYPGGSQSTFVTNGFKTDDDSFIVFISTNCTNITGVNRTDTINFEGVIL